MAAVASKPPSAASSIDEALSPRNIIEPDVCVLSLSAAIFSEHRHQSL